MQGAVKTPNFSYVKNHLNHYEEILSRNMKLEEQLLSLKLLDFSQFFFKYLIWKSNFEYYLLRSLLYLLDMFLLNQMHKKLDIEYFREILNFTFLHSPNNSSDDKQKNKRKLKLTFPLFSNKVIVNKSCCELYHTT